MKYSEFKSLIEKTYAGKFPRSFCKVYINRFSTAKRFIKGLFAGESDETGADE